MQPPPSITSLKNNAALAWKVPLIALGFALITTISGAAWLQIASERKALLLSLTQEANNLGLIFEQNTERTASEIDRIIRYLRASYERSGFRADWPTLVQEEFTASRRSVQIAVMDAKGMMITSSKMLYPKNPVDLSDREHFRVHADALQFVDRLFISKPVLGRATNKWSVQFTRPYRDEEMNFAGVIVVSLDPEFLTRNFSALRLGDDGGLAIVGDDAIVRAGAGIFRESFGKRLSDDVLAAPDSGKGEGAFVRITETDQGPRATVVRKLKDFPLQALMAHSDAPMHRTFLNNRSRYIWGAVVLNVAILMALAVSMIRRRSYERQLDHLARHDSLTNLLNRREFNYCLSRHMRGGGRKDPFHVHLLDLDGFKHVNDTYGHPVGDELLAVVGQRLLQNTRACDVVARLGGDEFAVIQKGTGNTTAATTLADRLCKAIAKPYLIDGKRIEIGTSVGIVSSLHDFADEDHLMRSADLALYASKNSGGLTFSIYNDRMNDEARERREIEEGLRAAISLGQLEVHYQPIFSIDGLKMNSVEALIRWRHPEKGLIPPGAFIPIAEQSGLIVQIGAWVMERACCEIASRSPTLQVAVNVSAIEFRDGDVSASIRHALDVSGIDPKRVKVEITETTLMSQDRTTMNQLELIRDLGIRISMDDFGTGYSSLSYLQSYPIDYIKIDQSFVRGLGQSDNSTAIVEAISRLARSMGMTAIAEGVETERQLDMLRKIGCAEAQGYLLGKPKPIAEIFPEDHVELAHDDVQLANERVGGDDAEIAGGDCEPQSAASQNGPASLPEVSTDHRGEQEAA